MCLLLFLLTASVLAGAQTAHLRVVEGDTMLLDISLATDASWIMRWNHSVTGITVSDYYRWDGEHLLLTDSHTPSFDAGLGHIPGRGRQVSDGQHGYFILGINEGVPANAYLLRVGSARVNHRIVHAGQTYSLSELAANRRVKIEVVTK